MCKLRRILCGLQDREFSSQSEIGARLMVLSDPRRRDVPSWRRVVVRRARSHEMDSDILPPVVFLLCTCSNVSVPTATCFPLKLTKVFSRINALRAVKTRMLWGERTLFRLNQCLRNSILKKLTYITDEQQGKATQEHIETSISLVGLHNCWRLLRVSRSGAISAAKRNKRRPMVEKSRIITDGFYTLTIRMPDLRRSIPSGLVKLHSRSKSSLTLQVAISLCLLSIVLEST